VDSRGGAPVVGLGTKLQAEVFKSLSRFNVRNLVCGNLQLLINGTLQSCWLVGCRLIIAFIFCITLIVR